MSPFHLYTRINQSASRNSDNYAYVDTTTVTSLKTLSNTLIFNDIFSRCVQDFGCRIWFSGSA